jgi:hypothetical protein
MAKNEWQDFQDDGGTPQWRRSHFIDVTPEPSGFLERCKRLTFLQKINLVLIAGLVLPWVILFGSISMLALYDAIIRHMGLSGS